MARIVCPNCGYRNKGNEKICVKCGYYLLPDMAPASPTVPARPAAVTQPPDAAAPESYGSVILVVDRAAGWVRLATGLMYAVIIVLLVLVYYLNLTPIIIFPLLIAIWTVSPIIRRKFSGIRFSPTGFAVKADGGERDFTYDSIEGGHISGASSGRQKLLLSLKNRPRPVAMEFSSMSTFRLLLMNLGRRGINITSDNQRQHARSRMM